MKTLVCLLCSGNSFVKEGSEFVCQNCGTRYTIDEAKKMVAEDVANEGSVGQSASVKPDNSDELENLYMIARRAKDDNNAENASKYYDMILVRDPSSWEAAFFLVYFKAMECKIAGIQSAAYSVMNCEESVFSLIKNNVAANEQANAVFEVVRRCSMIANMLANGAENHYAEIDPSIMDKYTQEFIDRVWAARDIMYTCGNLVEKMFGNNTEIVKYAASAWKSGIMIHEKILPYLADKESNNNTINYYLNNIGKYDREYVYRKKKAALEEELEGLQNTLCYTKNSKHPKPSVLTAFGVMGIVMAIIYVVIDITSGFFGFSILGLLFLVLAILNFRNAGKEKRRLENTQQVCANLEAKIAAKQNEIASLTV